MIFLATFELVYRPYMGEAAHEKVSRLIKADTYDEARDKLLKAYPGEEYAYTYFKITAMIE